MKRYTLLSAVLFALLLMVPAQSQAQATFQLGPRIGIDFGDIEEVFIGADLRVTTENLPVVINPTFDFYFTPENFTFWGLSANGLYAFGVDNEAFTPYAGAGLGIYRFSFDGQSVGGVTVGGGSSTDIGLNLLFGAQFITERTLVPFVEAQYTPVFTEGSTTTLFGIKGGILFNL